VGLKLILNAEEWIKSEWIDEIKSVTGLRAPVDLFAKEKQELHQEDIRARNAGYSMEAFYYTLIEQSHLSFEITDIPEIGKGKLHWWVVKMLPGQFMPVHRDPRITTKRNIERYWMPWIDWDYGHIFYYENTVITDYRKGDLFLMEDPDALHGAANIGMTPRITLNIGVEKT
jgi:hypothetical protein